MTPPNRPPGMTPEEAIFEVREQMATLTAVLIGVPNTDDTGLVGAVKDDRKDLDATRKKVGKLELKFWLLIGLLSGSGILGGFGLVKMLAP